MRRLTHGWAAKPQRARAVRFFAVGMLTSGRALAQHPEPAIEDYLRDSIGVTAARARRRSPRQRAHQAPPTVNPRDVTVFGIVQIATTRDAFAPRLADARRIVSLRSPTYEIFDDPASRGERGASRRGSVGVQRAPRLPRRALRLQASRRDDARFRDGRRLDERRRQPAGRLDRAGESAPIRQRLSGRPGTRRWSSTTTTTP